MALAGLIYGEGKSASITVADTATELRPATGGLLQRNGIVIINVSGVNVFIGHSGVTTTNGYQLASGADLFIAGPIRLWGIVATGTADVRILELA